MKKENEKVDDKNNSFEQKGSDYILAIFLIFIGGVLLLNTTGMIEWNIWTILWRFWPLLIVFAGLSLIFENSRILSIFVALFALCALSLAFLWSASLIKLPDWIDNRIERNAFIEESYIVSVDEFDNLSKKVIDIDMSVGLLSVTNNDFQDHLLLDAKYFKNLGMPTFESLVRNDDVLDVNLELGKGTTSFFWGTSTTPRYALILGSDQIPTVLSVNIGAGQGKLELDNYDLESLNIEVGAGDSKNKFSNLSINDLSVEAGAGNLVLEFFDDVKIGDSVNVKVGVGQLTLILPENIEYELEADIGLGSIKTEVETISGFGEDKVELKSEGYDSSDQKIKIVAEVGIGQLIIK